MRRIVATMTIAALAACSGNSTADYAQGAKVPEGEAEAQAAIEQAVARNGAASTAVTGVPVSAPKETAARDRAFPREFQGYWGMTPDDCELANVVAEGRINIDADRIRFYESRARVTALHRNSPYAVTVDLRFEGEGRTWTRRGTLRLDGGGTALIRTEEAPPSSVRYQRC